MMREHLLLAPQPGQWQWSVQEPWIKCPRQFLSSGGASEKMLARHRQARTPVPLFKNFSDMLEPVLTGWSLHPSWFGRASIGFTASLAYEPNLPCRRACAACFFSATFISSRLISTVDKRGHNTRSRNARALIPAPELWSRAR